MQMTIAMIFFTSVGSFDKDDKKLLSSPRGWKISVYPDKSPPFKMKMRWKAWTQGEEGCLEYPGISWKVIPPIHGLALSSKPVSSQETKTTLVIAGRQRSEERIKAAILYKALLAVDRNLLLFLILLGAMLEDLTPSEILSIVLEGLEGRRRSLVTGLE